MVAANRAQAKVVETWEAVSEARGVTTEERAMVDPEAGLAAVEMAGHVECRA